jgi:hypothetical protein
MRFFQPAAGRPRPPTRARSTAFLHPALRLGVYDYVRVAAKSNSTAAASWSSCTAKMNDGVRGVKGAQASRTDFAC